MTNIKSAAAAVASLRATMRLVIALLWALAPRYLQAGDAPALRTWLRAFGDRDLAARPALAVTAAAYHLAEGRRDEAERSTNAAARALEADAHGSELTAAIALLRACIARGGIADMGDEAARAADLTPADGAAQAPARLLMGVAHHLGGDRAAARTLLEDAAGRAAGTAPAVAALAHAQLALLAAEADDWSAAAHASSWSRSRRRPRHARSCSPCRRWPPRTAATSPALGATPPTASGCSPRSPAMRRGWPRRCWCGWRARRSA